MSHVVCIALLMHLNMAPIPNADEEATTTERGAVTQVDCFTEAPFASCHASSLIALPGREVLVTYFAGTDEGEPDVGIWLSRGRLGPDFRPTWNPPRQVVDVPGVPCWNPVLHRMATGELLLFYKAGPSPREWSGFLIRSDDLGRTWSEPELLPAGILGPIRSKPWEDSEGRLICGSSVESYRAWACWVEITPDAGRTWTKHGPIGVPGRPYGIIQPSVFPIGAEGRHLGFLARSRGIGRLCRSESRDGGLTWTDAEPIALPNPNAGADATRLADGRLAVIANPVERGRSPLAVAFSDDDGRTFDIRLTLEDEPGEYSYPALTQDNDGRIHMSYTWRRRRIRYASFDSSSLGIPSRLD